MNDSLIQYLSAGTRRFAAVPVLQHRRRNWEFYAVVEGRCGILLADDVKLPLRSKRLWVFPPDHLHGWHGEKRPCAVVVLHAASVPRQLADAIPSSGILERKLNAAQCRQIEDIEQSISPYFHKADALSELRFDQAVIEMAVLALGGDLTPPRRLAKRRRPEM